MQYESRRVLSGAAQPSVLFGVTVATRPSMIELAVAALVIGLIASLLGFTSIAGASFTIAKVIAAIFLVLFVVLILMAWGIGAALF
jgi:uncharacterized membrane protein YtjA (UPF0391 family)